MSTRSTLGRMAGAVQSKPSVSRPVSYIPAHVGQTAVQPEAGVRPA